MNYPIVHEQAEEYSINLVWLFHKREQSTAILLAVDLRAMYFVLMIDSISTVAVLFCIDYTLTLRADAARMSYDLTLGPEYILIVVTSVRSVFNVAANLILVKLAITALFSA